MAKKSSRALWTEKLKGGSSRKSGIKVPSVGKSFRGAVLGIDPSLRGTGLAIIQYNGQDDVVLIASKTLRFPPSISMPECLGGIALELSELLGNHSVDHVAIEQTIYVNNFQTAQIMGAARGAAIGVVSMCKKPVYEYSPLSIKKAVVGLGRASKEQVAGMVKQILKMPDLLPSDEADAVATALCHALTWREVG